MNNKLIGVLSIILSFSFWIVAAVILPNYIGFKAENKLNLYGGFLIFVTVMSLVGIIWGFFKFFKKSNKP